MKKILILLLPLITLFSVSANDIIYPTTTHINSGNFYEEYKCQTNHNDYVFEYIAFRVTNLEYDKTYFIHKTSQEELDVFESLVYKSKSEYFEIIDSEHWRWNSQTSNTDTIIVEAMGYYQNLVLGSEEIIEFGVYKPIYIPPYLYLYGNTAAISVRIVTSMNISGSHLICTSENYTINYLPDFSNIDWSNGPYLTETSSPGSNPATFFSTGNGSSWISATITIENGQCQLSPVTIPNYNVWSGVPQVQVTGPSEGCIGNEYTFYANYSPYSNPSSLEWSISPEYYCNTIYGYDWWANAHFDCPYEELYQVRCTHQNACGTGNTAHTYIYIYDCGYGYMLSPNPASTEVTVTVTRTANLNAAVNAIFDVSIYDGYGVKYFQGQYSGDRFTIPVYNLKNGNYIFKIDNGKNIANKQLVIKH
ncbi:MAG TPA: T9SS type A sorting domain-containing protein [Bacteroidales bacterium]|nr:T9SS type A sorting domain-containing protein [Bacteroidales bacterium]HOK74356.1 T9SS type A sorting domain-containing protein [Bacteroidales bacterium]HOM41042.1 T9SS type A sorting domain-containing protein [Bacteroidales bacterium]HPP92108.1 T9SS type A sorting domain-containing protein [Bacteroidales bacterium]HQK70025.1 T9SS type A sorting domain-containing protein [Bacteroidales bacterium]